MSQFGVPTVGAPGEMPFDAERKTSGLAVTALVCSLIFCCPVTTVLGVLLGLIAVVTISGNPARKGKGLAVAAILIGILATLFTVWGGKKFYDAFIQPIMAGPREVLMAGFAGDNAALAAGVMGAPSEAEAAAFIAELRSRYGELRDVRFDESRQPVQGQAEVQAFYILEFEQGSRDAEGTFVFADQSTGQFVKSWSSIVVIDEELGDLIFPAPFKPSLPGASDAPASDGGG